MKGRWSPRNVVRALASLYDAIVEVALFPAGGAVQASPSAWSSVVPVVVATVVATAAINVTGFSFISAPQMETALGEAMARRSGALVDMETLTAFEEEENGAMVRQETRLAEMKGLYSSVVGQEPQNWAQIIGRSELNEGEGADDHGRVASFESTGLVWGQEWAKAQAQADASEIAMWQAIQGLADLRLRRGSGAARRAAVEKVDQKRLALVSSIAEVESYAGRFRPIFKSQMEELDLESEAVHTRYDMLRRALLVCVVLGVVVFSLSALFGMLLLSRGVQMLMDKRGEQGKEASR